ncbi:MAG: hypothetical protein RXR51_04160 [Nitrososphaeria archaeon]
MNLSHVVDALNEANRTVLSGHAKDGMKVIIDFSEEPYYGKLDMYVTRSKYKSGTYISYFCYNKRCWKRWKERLTLYSLPVTMLDTKKKIYNKEIARKLAKAISVIDGQSFSNRNDKIA